MKSFIFNIDKIQREYKDDKAIKTHYRPWQVVYVNVNEKGKGNNNKGNGNGKGKGKGNGKR